MERLDRHDEIHHELFDEDTAQIGSLGDIVEAHAGDAVFLTPKEKSIGGTDSGLSDFTAEMLESDPANDRTDPMDFYSAQDEDQVWSTDQTGTVAGIARGFGTHLPQDLGPGGFHIEEIPDQALEMRNNVLDANNELSDYDSENNDDVVTNARGQSISQPGVNNISKESYDEAAPGRISVSARNPRSADDELDATRKLT